MWKLSGCGSLLQPTSNHSYQYRVTKTLIGMESMSTYANRKGFKGIISFCQVSDCYYGVRNYWGALARQFWHGYYDPESSWTCGSICLAPEDQNLACSECEAGLQLSLQQLSNQEVLDEILSQLEGSGFCTGTTNEDLCTSFLPMATYQGLPLLAEGLIPDTWLQDQVCNQAVPGTC